MVSDCEFANFYIAEPMEQFEKVRSEYNYLCANTISHINIYMKLLN